MTTRKKPKRSPPSVRGFLRAAHEAGHDTLGIVHDPEALGYLEFTTLVRNLTERLAAIAPRYSRQYRTIAAAGTYAMWEPVARCIVRAMVRRLCEVPTDDRSAQFGDENLDGVAFHAVAAARPRLGKAWITDRRVPSIARQTAGAFRDHERFSLPTQFRCGRVPYTFHRQDDTLVVTKGGA